MKKESVYIRVTSYVYLGQWVTSLLVMWLLNKVYTPHHWLSCALKLGAHDYLYDELYKMQKLHSVCKG